MASMELLSHLVGINISNLTGGEIILLEAELLVHTCEELKEFFRKQHADYFCLMKFSEKEENIMLDNNFVGLIIKDILVTKEYTPQGVAYYTDTHEDVIQEVIDGRNTYPSAMLLRRSIDLHRLVRRDLYRAIMMKVRKKYLIV